MKKWSQQDLNQIQNILIALRKAKYEVQGDEILAFGQAVHWISSLHSEVKNSLQTLPSKVEMVAKATEAKPQEKKPKKK
jgi:hypothetical protein